MYCSLKDPAQFWSDVTPLSGNPIAPPKVVDMSPKVRFTLTTNERDGSRHFMEGEGFVEG